MKLFKQLIFILIIFLETETVFSENSLFNVNNISLEKKDKITNNQLANKAIKKGFDQLTEKILLKEDSKKLSDLNFSAIKQLVTYYQISNKKDEKNNQIVNFSVTFDKDKIHDLFYKKGILYSEISDKDLFILPIAIINNEINIFNNNYFYENWNKIYENELIEFILLLENIEIIQKINKNKRNLVDLNLNILFQEYQNKNIALVFIEDNKKDKKIYIKTKIQGKNISRSLSIKKENFDNEQLYKKIVIQSKKELINLVKSKN